MTDWNFGGSVSVEAHKHAKLLNFSGQLIDPDAWGVTLAQPKKKKENSFSTNRKLETSHCLW